MLQIGANHRCGSLWSEGQTPVAFIQERVHLLGDDLARIATCPGKKLGFLEHRSANLAITVQVNQSVKFRFKVLPRGTIYGQNVVGASGGLKRHVSF